MKISLDWISDFLTLPELSPMEIARALTRHTAEVEGVENPAESYKGMVVGRVLSLNKHPNADRLNLVETDIGNQTVQIVCGGQNLKKDMLVAVALPSSWVKWHGEGEPVQLSETKIRGESSHGMICAGEEIGLPTNNPPGAAAVSIQDLTWTNAKAGTPLAEALGKTGAILELDNKSLTHRPDLWGHYGIARELAAIFKTPLKPVDLRFIPSSEKKQVQVDIEDSARCPRFSSAILTGVRAEESPQWMKARLQAAGMSPHNLLVDVTNYVMLELGQPMHAYDRAVVGDHLHVRCAKKDERLLTLEGTEHPLHPEDLLICDGKNEPIGIAGIKGGMKSGIQENTCEIVLEAAHFDAIAVRKSATRHGLRTDASQRFEKSLDPSLTEQALARAIHLIQKECPNAKLEGPIHTVGTWKDKKHTLTLDPKRACELIGVDIPTQEITRILESLEFNVKKDGKHLSVTIPSHRATGDVHIEEDLVEEIARSYGYEKIPATLPALPIRMPIENAERDAMHAARKIFALALGFTEVMTYSFYGADRLKRCRMKEDGHLKVLNFLSEDQTHMRSSLTPNLLAVVADNAREKDHIKIFEFGRSYKDIGEFMPLEESRVTAVVAQKEEAFYEAKGALEQFLNSVGTAHYELKPSATPLPYAHPKKSMDLWIQGKNIGVLFTVHPAVLKAFGIPLNTAIFSLHFASLLEAKRHQKSFTPLPKFPSMDFDISVLVSQKTAVKEVEQTIRSTDEEGLMEKVALFDIYEGKNIPEGQKSLSFQISLRHKDRTLTEKEFTFIQTRLFQTLEKNGYKIRGL